MDETALTVVELDVLARHEATIDRGLRTFFDVGAALAAIRDGQLYRREHGTFEDYCRERWGLKRQRAYELIEAAGVVRHLSEISDTLPARESHAAPLAALPPAEQADAWQRAVETLPVGERMTAAHVERSACSAGAREALHQSKSAEWYTPAPYVEAAHELMGGIDLDPASNELANRVVGAAAFYTTADDGLARPWRGRVWLNPPYGKEAGESNQARWSQHLIAHHRRGDVPEAILLVTAAPGNQWFAPLWNYPICFVDHRIRFYAPTGEADQPTHSHVLAYLGPNVAGFRRIFSRFGVVAIRMPEAA